MDQTYLSTQDDQKGPQVQTMYCLLALITQQLHQRAKWAPLTLNLLQKGETLHHSFDSLNGTPKAAPLRGMVTKHLVLRTRTNWWGTVSE